MHFCTETFYRKIFSYKERRKTHTHSLHKHLFVISYYIAYIQIQILLPIDYYSLPIDWIVVCMCVFVRLNSVSMECEQFFLISSAIRHTSTSVGLFWGGVTGTPKQITSKRIRALWSGAYLMQLAIIICFGTTKIHNSQKETRPSTTNKQTQHNTQ